MSNEEKKKAKEKRVEKPEAKKGLPPWFIPAAVVVGLLLAGFIGWRIGRATIAAAPTPTPMAVAKAEPSPTATPTPTPVPSTATPTPAIAGVAYAEAGQCEGVHDYQLQDLTELSADNEFLHVQFYRWDGDPERETLLPPGRYPLKVSTLRGHVWELGPACTATEAIEHHVRPSIEHRQQMGADNAGYVHWTWLVNESLITVAWQAQPVPDVPKTISAVPTPTPSGVCKAIKRDLGTPGTVILHGGHAGAILEGWTNAGGVSQAMWKWHIKPGEARSLHHLGGALWEYPDASCTTVQVEKEFNANSLPLPTAAQRTAVGLP